MMGVKYEEVSVRLPKTTVMAYLREIYRAGQIDGDSNTAPTYIKRQHEQSALNRAYNNIKAIIAFEEMKK